MDWGTAIGLLLGFAALGRGRQQEDTAPKGEGVEGWRLQPCVDKVYHAIMGPAWPFFTCRGVPDIVKTAAHQIRRETYEARGVGIVYSYWDDRGDERIYALVEGWHTDRVINRNPSLPDWIPSYWLESALLDTTLYPYSQSAIVPLGSDAIPTPQDRMIAAWVAALRVWRPHIRYVRWLTLRSRYGGVGSVDGYVVAWKPATEAPRGPGLWDYVSNIVQIGGAIANVVAVTAPIVAPGLVADLKAWASKWASEMEEGFTTSVSELRTSVKKDVSKIMQLLPGDEIAAIADDIETIGHAILERTGIDALEVARRGYEAASGWITRQVERLSTATHIALDTVLHGLAAHDRGLEIHGAILCDGTSPVQCDIRSLAGTVEIPHFVHAYPVSPDDERWRL